MQWTKILDEEKQVRSEVRKNYTHTTYDNIVYPSVTTIYIE